MQDKANFAPLSLLDDESHRNAKMMRSDTPADLNKKLPTSTLAASNATCPAHLEIPMPLSLLDLFSPLRVKSCAECNKFILVLAMLV